VYLSIAFRPLIGRRFEATIRRRKDETQVSVAIGRNRDWVLPGVAFVAAGAPSAASLIWSLLGGGAGDPSFVQWTLALGGPRSDRCGSSGETWLANQLEPGASLRWLEEVLELEPIDG
jgi:hypothetical protein